MKSNRDPQRINQPRSKQQRAEKLRAWKARASAATRASQAHPQNAAPPPLPHPHAPTISLLNTIAILGRGLVERALAIFGLKQTAHAAGKCGPNPCAALLRVIRALIRAEALGARLRQDMPLPERALKTPRSPALPQAGPTNRSRRRFQRRNLADLIADAQRRAMADMERLLKTRSVSEIFATICRDLRIDPSRLTWRKTPPTQIPPAPILPSRYTDPQAWQAPEPPPIRPDPPTDPPG